MFVKHRHPKKTIPRKQREPHVNIATKSFAPAISKHTSTPCITKYAASRVKLAASLSSKNLLWRPTNTVTKTTDLSSVRFAINLTSNWAIWISTCPILIRNNRQLAKSAGRLLRVSMVWKIIWRDICFDTSVLFVRKLILIRGSWSTTSKRTMGLHQVSWEFKLFFCIWIKNGND